MAKKLALSERFESAWRHWDQAIAGLNEADFDSMEVYPHWTLKDILGHLYSYMHLALRHVQSYRKRRKLASPRAPSYGYFNRREAERLKGVPASRLRADMEAAYRELVSLLPGLNPEDLRRVFPSQWWNSTGRVSLRGLLLEEARHMRAHAAEVKKWRVTHRVKNRPLSPRLGGGRRVRTGKV